MGSYLSNGQQYAQPSDLYGVISQAALTHPSTGTAAQNAALLRASEEIDGYLNDQFELPLLTWGSDIVQKTCDIAAYRLVCLRGFNPESDGHFLDNYKMTVRWLESVASGKLTPDVQDSSPGNTPYTPTPAAKPNAVTASPINFTGGTTRGTCRR